MKKFGYADKPINGRGGQNVKLISNTDEKISESVGKFKGQSIYQELFLLPNIGDFGYCQVNCFVVGGCFGGSCVRVCESGPIIAYESFLYAVRVSDQLPEGH